MSTQHYSNRQWGRSRNVNWPVIILSIFFIGLVGWGIYGLNSMASRESPKVDVSADHIADLEIVKTTKANSWPTIRYEGFTLAFDERRHTPVWVGWELLGSETDGPEPRYNTFWTDEEVYGCANTTDYRNSGYDRGHMCPSADQKWSSNAMRDCFAMTNMVPQDHQLNAGAWSTLEKKERVWAQRDSAIIIVAGPIYSPSDKKRIGDTGVHVPGAFYKVFLAPYLERPRAIGFVYPNGKAPGNMQDYAMSVDEVERLTGLDFFAALPDDLEEMVESRFSFNEWNRR